MIELLTMTIQLIGGEPDGIRICRVEGKSLVTVVAPRSRLSEAKRLPYLPHRGIYYLLDENHGVLRRVYAGQTTQGLIRLEEHKARKEFWNKAIMFLDEETNIDRDVLDGLEAKAIDYVKSHGDYETDNAVAPSPTINPYKEQRIEMLHEDVLFRMRVLGYDLDRDPENPTAINDVFHTRKNGVHAKGRYDKETGNFTVLAGSEVALDRSVINNRSVAATRNQLFGEATEHETLEDDMTFASPSAAAVFVLGGSQNGWTEWADSDGNTLSDAYRMEKN